jgi:hypothetical protein
MKTIRASALLACVLLLGGLAEAGVVTVTDTLDYTDNLIGPYYFWDTVTTLDHSPFYRTSLEDWDWTHNVKGLVPPDANGIQSATLSILAWDVDAEEGEVDIVYGNGVKLGTLQGMPAGDDRTWTTTVLNLPPQVLQELWTDREVTIFLDIDRETIGDRVTIRNSILSVNYTTPGGGGGGQPADPNATVYRFWSAQLGTHFYTISEEERDFLIANFGYVWTFEGVAYHLFGAALNADIKPIYRFWSSQLGTHFYTISEEEKDFLAANFWYIWTLEGVAFYAYPEGHQPEGTKPVYRFWSASLGRHVYTLRDDEKQVLLGLPNIWTLEGVAWYAYE